MIRLTSTLHTLNTMRILLLVLLFTTACSHEDSDTFKSLSIVIPDKIGSLVVGKSNYTEITKLLGDPELTENENNGFLDLRYPRKGIEFSIDKSKQMRISRIEVYRPFTGISAEGLRIGMPIYEARKIVSSLYGNPSVDLEDYLAWEINKSTVFALKREKSLVVAIKMLGE